MKKVLTWGERCEKHPSHRGIVTSAMIQSRMQEEIDELRSCLKETQKAIKFMDKMAKRKLGVTG